MNAAKIPAPPLAYFHPAAKALGRPMVGYPLFVLTAPNYNDNHDNLSSEPQRRSSKHDRNPKQRNEVGGRPNACGRELCWQEVAFGDNTNIGRESFVCDITSRPWLDTHKPAPFLICDHLPVLGLKL